MSTPPTAEGQFVRIPGTGTVGVVTTFGRINCLVRFDGSADWWHTHELEVVFDEEPEKPVPDSALDEFSDVSKQYYDEAHELLVRKHHDYSGANIARTPGGPLNGLRVRMWDKFARINNLIESGVDPKNESLRDSFVDMLNYSAIGLMVIDNNWPET